MTRGGLLRHRVVQLTLADWSPRTSLLRAGSLCFRGLFLNTYPFPGSTRSRDMSRKRQRLVPETLGLKRWRERGHAEADPLRGEAGSARAAVTELVGLFPRGLFEDALPPIALKSQVYSLVPDRTAADRQLVRGASATDRSRTQNPQSVRQPFCRSASVRFFLCQALQCYKPCKKILGQ